MRYLYKIFIEKLYSDKIIFSLIEKRMILERELSVRVNFHPYVYGLYHVYTSQWLTYDFASLNLLPFFSISLDSLMYTQPDIRVFFEMRIY